MTKKALVFNPYFNTLGGGEYYCLTVIEFLLKHKYQVEIAWFNDEIIAKIQKRFAIILGNKVKINKKAFSILSSKKNLLKKYFFEKIYQLIFFVSDGSIPWLFGNKNWIHFQVPFNNVDGSSLLTWLKLKNIDQIICNSKFVKKHIDQEFKVNAIVIYPPLNKIYFDLNKIKKENIILNVGRFDEQLNSKKQDILVKVFKKMVNEGLKDWHLILVGGLLKKDNSYLFKLKQDIKNYPIKILTNLNFEALLYYYQKARIYWHAAGFGEDLQLHPEKAEHFGISILEAMASGNIPLVYGEGGPREIISEQNKDLLWLTLEELILKTKKIITSRKKLNKLSLDFKKLATKYDKETFFSNLAKLIND